VREGLLENRLFFFWVVLATLGSNLYPQTAPSSKIIGELTNIDAGANRLTLKTDKGEILLTLAERTRYLRVQPGETDLKNAGRIAVTDLATGDRVLALGRLSEDGRTLAATSVIVMTKADIAKKQEHDQSEWKTRSITGVIAAIAQGSSTFTARVHTAQGEKTVMVEAGKAEIRRYAPDSVRFQDARPGSFPELSVGDHVRVLGDKTADSNSIKAEVIVSGKFRTVAATVIATDAAAHEIKVTDLATRKPLVIRVNADTTARRLPPPMAMALARRYNPQFVRSAAARGAANAPGGGETGVRFSGSQGADLQQMLERLPAMPLDELKKDDAIIISTAGSDAARVTAITLIAGVEPLLTRASSGQLSMDWSLDMGMPQ
jgi:hypothetical protein